MKINIEFIFIKLIDKFSYLPVVLWAKMRIATLVILLIIQP